ncbi:MAG: prolyl oligopeptidase family serine peptidase [Neisseriaceae bacterium]|nr:MAG: prolyl oligopeptidase family serine peptidase [Neisseriaceae bacterium]
MNNLENEFIQTESQKTIDIITSHADWMSIKKNITNILNSEAHIAYCEEHQGKMYHLLQNHEYPKGVYRCCSVKDYRAGLPNWELIFNVADFDEILNDDIYLEAYMHFVENPNLILLVLSSKGQDMHYTLEFNISKKNIVTDGFNFPLSKSFVQWRDENSVWLNPAWEENQITSSGYSRQVYLLKRGQNLSEATLVFEGQQDDIFIEAWRYLDVHSTPLDVIKQSHYFSHFSYYIIQENLQILPLSLPKSCHICGYLNSYLLIHLKQDWVKSKETYLSGSVLAIKLQKGKLKTIIPIFIPQEHQVVESIETSKDYIFIHYLDNIYSKAYVTLFKNGDLKPINFPELGTINFELIDQPWRSNIFYIAANDLTHEPTLYAWDAKREELSILRQQKSLFNTNNISIHQYFASSEDNTQIPYFWCGTNLTHETPTLIYCYGGFSVNELPHYMPVIGKLWLEKGFSFVIANIRGGAELGEYWHQEAVRENKYKSIEDLIAVIQDLQKNKRTSPAMTAIQGASNGGLIVANAMTDVPDLLKTVLCEVPIIDMQNYTKYGSGYLWKSEYGDPNDPKIIPYLEKINVLNKISDKIRYPELFITTSLSDDRVSPKHALLLHKKMLNMGHTSSHLISYHQGGHESLNAQDEYIQELAYLWFFLYNAMGLNFETMKS